MKTKYLLMTAIMLLGLMSFTACGDDDDDDINSLIEKFEKGELKPAVSISGTNPIIFKAEWKGVQTEVHTATFNSDESLKSYIIVMTYANSKLADAEWNDIVEDGEEDPEWFACFSRKGNTITYDATKYVLEEVYDEMDEEDREMFTDQFLVTEMFKVLKSNYEKGRYDY